MRQSSAYRYSWSDEVEQTTHGYSGKLGGRAPSCQEIRGLGILLRQRHRPVHSGTSQVSQVIV